MPDPIFLTAHPSADRRPHRQRPDHRTAGPDPADRQAGADARGSGPADGRQPAGLSQTRHTTSENRHPAGGRPAYVLAVLPRPSGVFFREGGCVAAHRRLLADRGAAAQAAGATMWARADGGTTARPSSSSAPPSSKITTPLHSRLHPCSGWLAMTLAPLRSCARAPGMGADAGTAVPRAV